MAADYDFSHTAVHDLFTKTTTSVPRQNVLLDVVEYLARKNRRIRDVEAQLDRFEALWRAADDVPFSEELSGYEVSAAEEDAFRVDKSLADDPVRFSLTAPRELLNESLSSDLYNAGLRVLNSSLHDDGTHHLIEWVNVHDSSSYASARFRHVIEERGGSVDGNNALLGIAPELLDGKYFAPENFALTVRDNDLLPPPITYIALRGQAEPVMRKAQSFGLIAEMLPRRSGKPNATIVLTVGSKWDSSPEALEAIRQMAKGMGLKQLL